MLRATSSNHTWARCCSMENVIGLGPGQTVLPTQANSSQVDGQTVLPTQAKWMAKRSSQPKPTRAKFTTSMELGIVWPSTWLELDRVGLNLIKLNLRPTRARFSTVWPPQPTQANSRQVVLLSLFDWRGRNQVQVGSTWLYRLAAHRCKFWFCNLARVGLSWEYRLARA